jgi:hypothetical protein
MSKIRSNEEVIEGLRAQLEALESTSRSQDLLQFSSKLLSAIYQNMVTLEDYAFYQNVKEDGPRSSRNWDLQLMDAIALAGADEDTVDQAKTIIEKQVSLFHKIGAINVPADKAFAVSTENQAEASSKLHIIDDPILTTTDYEPDALQQALIDVKLKLAEKFAAYDELYFNYRQMEKIGKLISSSDSTLPRYRPYICMFPSL